MKNLDKQVEDLFNFTGETIKENANKDANIWSTKRDLLAGILSRDYGLRVLIPKNIVKLHQDGSLHYHDSDYSPLFGEYNCQLIAFKDMLAKGFVMGNADIESAKGIETATALISQIVANVSSNCYGGTTINRADEILEPYAKLTYEKHLKDAKKYVNPRMIKKYAKDKTRQSIHNAIQSLEYELNTLYSSNG